ncbi:hypothetical protein K440DRAFT_660633 [Wilcoxina mikolae CBS 423.85]|nr:hypothetical protein K440DRAFT_660633 [Wilcoxina mikolae CBS 423.85]
MCRLCCSLKCHLAAYFEVFASLIALGGPQEDFMDNWPVNAVCKVTFYSGKRPTLMETLDYPGRQERKKDRSHNGEILSGAADAATDGTWLKFCAIEAEREIDIGISPEEFETESRSQSQNCLNLSLDLRFIPQKGTVRDNLPLLSTDTQAQAEIAHYTYKQPVIVKGQPARPYVYQAVVLKAEKSSAVWSVSVWMEDSESEVACGTLGPVFVHGRSYELPRFCWLEIQNCERKVGNRCGVVGHESARSMPGGLSVTTRFCGTPARHDIRVANGLSVIFAGVQTGRLCA